MALFIQSTGADEFMRAMNPPDLQGDTPVQYNLPKKKEASHLLIEPSHYLNLCYQPIITIHL